MFEVIVCEDKIPLPYHHMIFDNETKSMTVNPQVLCDIISCRFNDRVLPNYGLLIELYDIVKAFECKSLPDIPVSYVRCVFRYIVFNPPVGSVWQATISGSNEEGISLSMSFFSDIWIPWPNLPDGCEFGPSEEIWFWLDPQGEESETDKVFFDFGEEVRFRVCEVKYSQNEQQGSLMQVIGSMSTNGLGITKWWVEAIDSK